MSEEEKKPENAYDELEKKGNELFKTQNSVPEAINNIKVDDNKYSEITIGDDYTIQPPKAEIQKANQIANALIKQIDSKNSKTFSKYKSIINSILRFVRDYDALYVQTTEEEFDDESRNDYAINQFADKANQLDQQISQMLPEVVSPISSVVNYMSIDNSFAQMNSALAELKNRFLVAYQEELAIIFKYITIGEA